MKIDPQNLSLKDVLILVTPVVLLISGLTIFRSGYEMVGLLLLLPVAVSVIYYIRTMPRETMASIQEADKRQSETLLGKLLHYLKVGILLYLAGALIWQGLKWLGYVS